jgi:hypothetical protein|tara:strand:- start:1529 stop:1696 length:168 start_codon:yes stop_codon:yes gene_type:complete
LRGTTVIRFSLAKNGKADWPPRLMARKPSRRMAAPALEAKQRWAIGEADGPEEEK